MEQIQARHVGAWLLTIAFETAAGILSQWQAWTLVTILFWMGITSLLIGYLPDLRGRFQSGKLLGVELLRQGVVSFVLLCAVYFVTVIVTMQIRQWSIVTPYLFEPESWALQNRAFVTESPDELAGYYTNYTDTNATKLLKRYIGKWYAISGTVEDVRDMPDYLPSSRPGGPLQTKNRSAVTLQRRISSPAPIVQLRFEEKWESEIEILNKGDKISAYCKINQISVIFIWLENCQLVRR